MIRKFLARQALRVCHRIALGIHAHIHREAVRASQECTAVLAATTDPARRNEAVTALEDRMKFLNDHHTSVVKTLDQIEELQERAAAK